MFLSLLPKQKKQQKQFCNVDFQIKINSPFTLVFFSLFNTLVECKIEIKVNVTTYCFGLSSFAIRKYL